MSVTSHSPFILPQGANICHEIIGVTSTMALNGASHAFQIRPFQPLSPFSNPLTLLTPLTNLIAPPSLCCHYLSVFSYFPIISLIFLLCLHVFTLALNILFVSFTASLELLYGFHFPYASLALSSS